MTEVNEVRKKSLSIEEQREGVVFRAVEDPTVIRMVDESNSRIEAVRQVRLILKERFPEVALIPTEKFDPDENIVGRRLKNLLGRNPSAEYLIARDIVKLLRDWKE